MVGFVVMLAPPKIKQGALDLSLPIAKVLTYYLG